MYMACIVYNTYTYIIYNASVSTQLYNIIMYMRICMYMHMYDVHVYEHIDNLYTSICTHKQ